MANEPLFLARRLRERLARLRLARGERLSLVERLRADLADVVHAHQRRGMTSLFLHQRSFCDLLCGRSALGMRDAGNRAQRAVEFCDQAIHCGDYK
jgi:hypothetical protein